MDKRLESIVRQIIKDDIGDLVSHELEVRFRPLQRQIEEWQTTQDHISEQIKEDREDLNQLRIDMSKSLTQNKVIIENQNTAEDKVVEAVEEAAEKIPEQVEESVNKVMGKESFMDKILK